MRLPACQALRHGDWRVQRLHQVAQALEHGARCEADQILMHPGGFVEGVRWTTCWWSNRSRATRSWPARSERIGLAERTGHGVNTDLRGLLRYGRPAPDYARSDPTTMVVQLSSPRPTSPSCKWSSRGKRQWHPHASRHIDRAGAVAQGAQARCADRGISDPKERIGWPRSAGTDWSKLA